MQRPMMQMAQSLVDMAKVITPGRRGRKTILRTGPAHAADARGGTPPDADTHECPRNCDHQSARHCTEQCVGNCADQSARHCHCCAAQPTPAPEPAPATWSGAPPAGPQMNNGVGLDTLDLFNDFNTGLGGNFDALMSGALLDDLEAQYQLPTLQPVPAATIAPAQTQTQPRYQSIMETPPPRPDGSFQDSTAGVQGTPPASPKINPAAPGLAWTGDAWHGPVWVSTLPIAQGRPGTRRRPLTPASSRLRHSSSISSRTLDQDDVSVKVEDSDTDTNDGQDEGQDRRGTSREPIDVDDDQTEDLFSDGEPGFGFPPGLRTPEEI